jgi:hypothetical protein
MTSALVGDPPFAVDDTAGTVFRVDNAAGAVPEEAGFEAVPGAAERGVSALLGASRLLEVADEIAGPGPGGADCAAEQPVATASTAVAAHRIRLADRCRGRRDRLPPFIITVGWPNTRSTLPS